MAWGGAYPSNVVICDTTVLPFGRLRKSGSVKPPNPPIRPDDKWQLSAKLRAPSFPFLFAERVGDHKSHQHQGLGKAPAFSRPIRPFGPTTKGSESAFQLPSSSGCHVRPSSRLTSDPSVPAVIHTLSDSN